MDCINLANRVAKSIAGSAALLFCMGATGATCKNWDLTSKELSFEQGNRIGVALRLVQQGQDITGEAWQTHLSSKDTLLQKLNLAGRDPVTEKGRVDGVRDGNQLDLKVYWRAASIGIYRISVDEHGQLSGSTYDFHRPSSKARLVGYGRVDCADAPAPVASVPAKPVRQLGKRPAGGTPTACTAGFVWREANSADKVCVKPESRDRVTRENATASTRWVNDSKSCVSGYVWREAFAGDQVCVTPMTRDTVREENRLASQRTAG